MLRKKVILAIALSVGLLISCGDNNKKKDQIDQSSSAQDETQMVDTGKAENKAPKMTNQEMEELEKKLDSTPHVTPDNLKKAIPEALLGIKATDRSLSSSVLAGSVLRGNGTYEKDSNHILKLYITDGAGDPGSSVVSMEIRNIRNVSADKAKEAYVETVKLDNRWVKIEKKNEGEKMESKLTFAVNDQFLVNLSGIGFTPEELKKAYNELDFSSLNN